MKRSFIDYLAETKRVFEFKLKFANIELTDDVLDKLERVLKQFDLISIGKAKSQPVAEQPFYFPRLGPVEVVTIDVAVNYPTTTDQIHRLVSDRAGISFNKIVVVTEEVSSEEDYARNLEEKEDGAILLKDLEVTGIKSEDYYGQKHIENFLKAISRGPKFEIAGKEKD